MIKLTHSFKILGAVFAACYLASSSDVAAAPGYSTTFDGSPFVSGSTVSGYDGWDTNDPDNSFTTSTGSTIGQSEVVKFINTYSTGTSDRLAVLGGLFQPDVVPGQGTVQLYVPFNITMANGGNGEIYFVTKYAVTDSGGSFATRDTFGWTFANSAGNRIAVIRFAPTGGSNLGIYLDTFNSSNVLLSSTLTSSGLYQPYNTSPLYKLEVKIDTAGMLNAAITDSLGTKTTIFSGQDVSTAGIATENISRVAATWSPTDTTTDNGGYVNAGSNALLFNDYTVIPEPSTIGLSILAGIGGLGMVIRRRKQS